jgi:predicted nucleic acid-binding protein
MLVDTNVLVDVLQSDPDWADWSIAQLQAQSKVHRLAINPIIYEGKLIELPMIKKLQKLV